MTLEIIDGFERLVEFEPQWSTFARAIKGLTPFQLPEWLLTWWRRFGNGQLHVLVNRSGNEIVGIVPCFVHEWNGRRQMTLIGSGISDYLDPAIQPAHEGAVVDELKSHLAVNADWDICNWQDLSEDTPLKGLASEVVEDAECRTIPLMGDFNEYWKLRSKSLRQNVRRDKEKAESTGPLQFETNKDANGDVLDSLIRLHAARWREHGEAGMIEANRSTEFLKDIACEFARRDMLRLFSLRFKERIAAVILGFSYNNTLFNYLTALRSGTCGAWVGPYIAFRGSAILFRERLQEVGFSARRRAL